MSANLHDLVRAQQGGRRRGIGGPPSAWAWATTGLRSLGAAFRSSGPLPAASVLLAALALGMVGIALALSSGVANATVRWQGGVETIVFLRHDADPEQAAAIGDRLRHDPLVRSVTYVDAQAARDEFATMFADDPALVSSVSDGALPTSWKVVPNGGVDQERLDALSEQLRATPGVYAVADAADAVHPILRASALARRTLVALSLLLGAIWCVLAYATARSAVWARREELAVMRLVGAPRSLIGLPLTGEGAVIGLLGGVLAVAFTRLVVAAVERWSRAQVRWPLVRGFEVGPGTQWRIAVLLLVIGTLAGAATAHLASRSALRT